ncbi:MAG TPA: hypothetical protein ENJ95_07300 [Bacteroidetes bacterium]|nr:hypothetical protein [Bacteroidota bacterium]
MRAILGEMYRFWAYFSKYAGLSLEKCLARSFVQNPFLLAILLGKLCLSSSAFLPSGRLFMLKQNLCIADPNFSVYPCQWFYKTE